MEFAPRFIALNEKWEGFTSPTPLYSWWGLTKGRKGFYTGFRSLSSGSHSSRRDQSMVEETERNHSVFILLSIFTWFFFSCLSAVDLFITTNSGVWECRFTVLRYFPFFPVVSAPRILEVLLSQGNNQKGFFSKFPTDRCSTLVTGQN